MEALKETLEAGFFSALSGWREASQRANALKYEAKRAYLAVYLSSDGKTETFKANEAESLSLALHEEAESARLEAKAAEMLVEYTLATIKQ